MLAMHVVLVRAPTSYAAKLERSKRAEVFCEELQLGQLQSDDLRQLGAHLLIGRIARLDALEQTTRHGSCCISLIHEDAATDHCVERAALGESDIEATLDEGDVGNASLVRFFPSQIEHLRASINRKHVPLFPNTP